MVSPQIEKIIKAVAGKKVDTQGLYDKAENREGREIIYGNSDSVSGVDYISENLYSCFLKKKASLIFFDIGFSESKKIPGIEDNIDLPTYFRKISLPYEKEGLDLVLSGLPKAFPDEGLYKNIIKQEVVIGENKLPSLLISQTRIYQAPKGIQVCTAYQIPNTTNELGENIGFTNFLETSKQVALVANDIYDILTGKVKV